MNTNDLRNKVDRLLDIRREMMELTDEAMTLVRQAKKELPHADAERDRRTWFANLQTALSNDTGWLGREHSLEDAIRGLEEDLGPFECPNCQCLKPAEKFDDDHEFCLDCI